MPNPTDRTRNTVDIQKAFSAQTVRDNCKLCLVNLQNETMLTIPFQFFPEKINESVGGNWYITESPGQFRPFAQFSSTGPHTFDFSLYYHHKGEPERHKKVLDAFRMLQTPQKPSTFAKFTNPVLSAPPKCYLLFGDESYHVAPTGPIKFEHSLFNFEGKPTCTTINLEFTVLSDGLESDIAELDRRAAFVPMADNSDVHHTGRRRPQNPGNVGSDNL